MNHVEAAQAAGMLRIAVRRMMKEHPFYAHLLSPDSLVCDPTVGTMGVTIRGGRLQFLYCPAFVSGCSFDELATLLQHEVNHVLFDHVLAPPDRFPDLQARIIAEEVTANEWVVGPLPGTPLTLLQFPELAPLGDTESRYHHLARKDALLGPKTGREGLKSVQDAPKSGRSPSENERSYPRNGTARPLDNHEIWAEALVSPTIGRMAVAAAVQRAREALTVSEWANLPTDVRQRIERLAVGITPGDAQEELPDADSAQTIPWRRLLRRCISRSLQLHPTFNRPPRRRPELVGIVPANVRLLTKPVVMAIIDTSGSMDLAILHAVRGELTVLTRDYDVTVVECDAEIQAHYPYRGRLTTVRGRGGTDLRPPLEANFLAKIRPDVIVYFTDGDGIAPSIPSSIPVVWCLTPEGARPVSWGKEVRMHGQGNATSMHRSM